MADKCLCVDPGDLRHRVEISMPVKERDSLSGHVKESWIVIASVKASIKPATTVDIWQAAQVQTKVSHRVIIRYRPGVTGEMVFRFRGRQLNIVGQPLDLEELHVWLLCLCCEPG